MDEAESNLGVVAAAILLGEGFTMSNRACRDDASWRTATREEAREEALRLGVRWRIQVWPWPSGTASSPAMLEWLVSSMPRGTTAMKFKAPDEESVRAMSVAVNEQHELRRLVAPSIGKAAKAGKRRRL